MGFTKFLTVTGSTNLRILFVQVFVKSNDFVFVYSSDCIVNVA